MAHIIWVKHRVSYKERHLHQKSQRKVGNIYGHLAKILLLHCENGCLNLTPGFDIKILVLLLTGGSGVLGTWVPTGTH